MPCIDFLQINYEHLVRVPGKVLYATFVEILLSVHRYDCGPLVEGTPGVRVVVATAWNMTVDGPDDVDLRNVSFFLNWDSMKAQPRALEEYMEGAGGLYSLASIIVKHLDPVFVNERMSLTFYCRDHVHRHGRWNSRIFRCLRVSEAFQVCTAFSRTIRE